MNDINNEKEISDIAINVKGLGKKYSRNKKYSIQDVSFVIRKGEFHGFIGANGAGKTTTIKSIIGAYASYEGEVSIFGFPNTSIDGKKHIGYIPENANFPIGKSTKWYIKYMSLLSGLTNQQAEDFTNKTLADLGLNNIASRNPNKLSSGQKKKVLLAQALVGNPDVLIMDEPAANLDPKARKDFFDTLLNIQKQGKSIFISSHILAELDEYVDAITILDGGKLVFSGRKDELSKDATGLEYSYKFKTKLDNDKFILIAKKRNLPYTINQRGEIVVNHLNKENIEIIMKEIIVNKLELSLMKEKKLSLSEIYDQFVILGSVDTGVGKESFTQQEAEVKNE